MLHVYWPEKAELHGGGLAEDVQVEADPAEGEEQPQPRQHQAVQLHQQYRVSSVQIHRSGW